VSGLAPLRSSMMAATRARVSLMCHSADRPVLSVAVGFRVHVGRVAQRVADDFPLALVIQAAEVATLTAGMAGRAAQLLHLVDQAIAITVQMHAVQYLHMPTLFALAPQGLARA